MRRALALAAVLAGPALAQEDPGEPLRPALTAGIAVLDLEGRPLDPVPPGEPFLLEVAVENQAGPEPPVGLRPAGWLRRVSARNLPCHQAARAFFATGSLPTDAVSLNGPVLGVLSEDRALTVVDPAISLASANLIGAATLPEAPSALVPAPLGGGFLVSLPEAGEVRALTAFGAEPRVVAEGLDRPGALLADAAGGLWVLEEGAGRLLRLDGAGEAAAEVAAVSLAGDARTVLARDRAGGVLILNAATGAPLAKLPPAEGAVAEALVPGPEGPSAVARVAGDRLLVYYLDAPATPQEIPLAGPATRLAVDPAGRFAFAWDPAGGPVSLVDLARGHLAQAVGAHGSAISEVVATEQMAVLLRADQAEAAAIALDSIRLGAEAQVRSVPLGPAAARPVTAPGFLLRVPGANEILAVHAGSFTGFVVSETAVIGVSPPMAAVRLRGGAPRMAAILARGFAETAPGRYRAGAVLPDPGRYELVLSTGVGELTLCHELPTAPVAEGAGRAGWILADIGEGRAPDGWRSVTLRFLGADDRPLTGVAGVVSATSLETGWLHRAPLPDADSAEGEVTLRLPPLGAYVLTLAGGPSLEFPPLVIEVEP